jgi:hypothetical protein
VRWVVNGAVLLDATVGFLQKHTRFIYGEQPRLLLKIEHGFNLGDGQNNFVEIVTGDK